MTKRSKHKCEWDVLAVEQTVGAHVKAKGKHHAWMPKAYVTSKPDLVIRATSLPGLANYVATRLGLNPKKCAVGVSHKTMDVRYKNTIEGHITSADTRAFMVAWNGALKDGTLSVPKAAQLPMVAVVLNFAIKDRKPDFIRRGVYASPLEDEHFAVARQRSLHLRAKQEPVRDHASRCMTTYGALCALHRFCHDAGVSAILEQPDTDERREALVRAARQFGLERVPWAERPGAPSTWGMSRYSTLDECSMKHHFLYDLELQAEREKSHALQVGSAFHAYLQAHYTGVVAPEERAAWEELSEAAQGEGRDLYRAYLKHWNVAKFTAEHLLL